jgi:hypothetical protein
MNISELLEYFGFDDENNMIKLNYLYEPPSEISFKTSYSYYKNCLIDLILYIVKNDELNIYENLMNYFKATNIPDQNKLILMLLNYHLNIEYFEFDSMIVYKIIGYYIGNDFKRTHTINNFRIINTNFNLLLMIFFDNYHITLDNPINEIEHIYTSNIIHFIVNIFIIYESKPNIHYIFNIYFINLFLYRKIEAKYFDIISNTIITNYSNDDPKNILYIKDYVKLILKLKSYYVNWSDLRFLWIRLVNYYSI